MASTVRYLQVWSADGCHYSKGNKDNRTIRPLTEVFYVCVVCMLCYVMSSDVGCASEQPRFPQGNQPLLCGVVIFTDNNMIELNKLINIVFHSYLFAVDVSVTNDAETLWKSPQLLNTRERSNS